MLVDQVVVRVTTLPYRRGTNSYPCPSFFPGFTTKEVAFFHKDSKSLIEADLLFNLPPKEQVGPLPLLLALNQGFTTRAVLEIQEDDLPSSFWVHQSVVVRAQTSCMVSRKK